MYVRHFKFQSGEYSLLIKTVHNTKEYKLKYAKKYIAPLKRYIYTFSSTIFVSILSPILSILPESGDSV